jgi:hypothetical protein
MDHLEEDLSAYISNELDESQKKSVEAHLATCPICTEKQRQLQKLENLTEQEKPIEPPPDFLKKVMSRIDRESRVIRFRSRRNVAIFVAAAVFAFFVFILSLRNPVRVPPPLVHHTPKPAISTPSPKAQEKSEDVELIAHLDELENMEVIRQFNDLDQFDTAIMLAESEVTK